MGAGIPAKVPAERKAAEEIERLRRQLDEANSIIAAIRGGEADALLVADGDEERVFVLNGADRVYRLMVEEMREGCATLDGRGTVLFCNRSFADILRLPPARVIGMSVRSLLSGPEGDALCDFLEAGRDGLKAEFPLKAGTGFWVPVIVSATNVAMGAERFACMVVTDLSEQKRSQKLNELILSQTTDAIIACDNGCRIVQANAAAAALLGGDLAGRDFHAAVPLMSEEDGKWVRLPAADHGPLTRREVIYRGSDGQEVNLLLSASRLRGEAEQEPFGYLVSLTNITELRRFHRELTRLDRLNIVGEMAAGIGHEVRNPLTTVRGYLQRFARKPALEAYREALQLMIEELDRANAIISEFLSLAKNKAATLVATDLNRVIRNLFPLLQANAFRHGSVIELELGDIPKVPADEKEIRQCLLNLVGNGLDAMPVGGRVTVRTAREGGRVRMTVRDEGPGIPPEVREKLGTPFFTTKEHGTGLGLPVCYRIAQRHRASIEVETGGAGTAFHFIFGA